jgi:hypothetical protein
MLSVKIYAVTSLVTETVIESQPFLNSLGFPGKWTRTLTTVLSLDNLAHYSTIMSLWQTVIPEQHATFRPTSLPAPRTSPKLVERSPEPARPPPGSFAGARSLSPWTDAREPGAMRPGANGTTHGTSTQARLKPRRGRAGEQGEDGEGEDV